ncbi:hypothetical protein [Daejeonella sp. H1SJ63]|uniref:class I SAM-dependent methyltransferase n=1 Tax=Daejeonella sp. H1SJ63 TaxID=3034145 RepID=UPI0023EE0BC9|nr:hypothetical protein [Daejeonella sp. H1SJ63]
MNKSILNTEIQNFINDNLDTDIPKLSLRKSPFASVSSTELAVQIDSKKRCENKLPTWFKTKGIYYPPKLAIEQCSSELAAAYKADLINGEDIIDLTGGFGVDSYYFALKAGNVSHCEINPELSEISKHNSKKLGVKINYLNTDGIAYLRTNKHQFDTIYIDPSRRIANKKVFLLKDCEPDVISNLQLLSERCRLLMIKTAPLLDIQSGIHELKAVSSVHVISIRNECKELLFLINNGETSADPIITCSFPATYEGSTYSFRISDEKNYEIRQYSRPLEYVYEPDVALLKAGCFKLITRDFALFKIHQHTHLYTSAELNRSFPGRIFKLKNVWEYGRFIKENSIRKANIITRNFPSNPEELKKKLKINDGGDEYILFCTGPDNNRIVIQCTRILNQNNII